MNRWLVDEGSWALEEAFITRRHDPQVSNEEL